MNEIDKRILGEREDRTEQESIPQTTAEWFAEQRLSLNYRGQPSFIEDSRPTACGICHRYIEKDDTGRWFHLLALPEGIEAHQAEPTPTGAPQ